MLRVEEGAEEAGSVIISESLSSLSEDDEEDDDEEENEAALRLFFFFAFNILLFLAGVFKDGSSDFPELEGIPDRVETQREPFPGRETGRSTL